MVKKSSNLIPNFKFDVEREREREREREIVLMNGHLVE